MNRQTPFNQKAKLFTKRQLSTETFLKDIKLKTFVFKRKIDDHSNLKTNSLMANWTSKEKQNLFIYIYYFRDIFTQLQLQQDKWSIFKAMAKFIKSRNSRQCRSYYLKLIHKFVQIQNYLKKVIYIIPKFSSLAQLSQAELIQIQKQFNLSLIKCKGLKALINIQHQCKQNKINSNQISQNGGLIDKNEKQDQIKTADSYYDQNEQFPVNLQNYKFSSMFSNYSKFKPFASPELISKKLSIPSFDDEESEVENFNRGRIAQINMPDQSINMQKYYEMKNNECLNSRPINNYNNHFMPGYYTAFPIYQTAMMGNESQKINSYMQIHPYYYQIWASQLSSCDFNFNNQNSFQRY